MLSSYSSEKEQEEDSASASIFYGFEDYFGGGGETIAYILFVIHVGIVSWFLISHCTKR